MPTTFSLKSTLDKPAPGLAFWPRYADTEGSVAVTRERLREWKAQGYKWLSLVHMDTGFQRMGKDAELQDLNALGLLLEQANDYDFKVVLRVQPWVSHNQNWITAAKANESLTLGEPPRGYFDGLWKNYAQVFKRVPRNMNALQLIGEPAVLNPTVAPPADVKALSEVMEREWARILPILRAEVPDLTVVLPSGIGWVHSVTKEYQYFTKPFDNTIRGFDLYNQEDLTALPNAFVDMAAKGFPVMVMECGFDAVGDQIMAASLARQVPCAKWIGKR